MSEKEDKDKDKGRRKRKEVDGAVVGCESGQWGRWMEG